MNKRKTLVLIIALVMVLSLAACGTTPSASQTPVMENGTSEAPIDPVDESVAIEKGVGIDLTGNDISAKPAGIQVGTVANYWISSDIPLRLPFSQNAGHAVMYSVYDNLLTMFKNNKDDIRGNLAESWEVSEDDVTWTFKLREGRTFSSGKEVTAEDFVKTYDVAKTFQGRFFAQVESYEAVSPYELVIHLASPNPNFEYELPCQCFGAPVDSELLEKYGPEDNRSAVGAGPYYFSDYVAGERIVLSARDDYNSPYPERNPCIETVNYVIITDINTATLAHLNNELDFVYGSNMAIYSNLIQQGREPWLGGDRVNPLWLNAKHCELFKDPIVREAIAHMINWEDVNLLAYDGLGTVGTSSFMSPECPPYDEKYDYDPDLGLKMLEDAGYSLDDIAFNFTCASGDTGLAEAIKGQLLLLGIENIEIDVFDGATTYGKFKGGEWDVFAQSNGYSVVTPLSVYSMGLLKEGSQRCIFLDYMDEAAYEEALKVYEAVTKSLSYEEYITNIGKLDQIIQDNICNVGGIRLPIFFSYTPDRFGGIYVSPVSNYIEICYLWDTTV